MYYAQMYERLSKLKSPNGVTVDKCIQPSVDNKGDIIGLVAGDPECYDVCSRCYKHYSIKLSEHSQNPLSEMTASMDRVNRRS